MAGYSATPLAKNSVLSRGLILILSTPLSIISICLPTCRVVSPLKTAQRLRRILFIFFVLDKDDYYTQLPELKYQLKPNGMIWASWPKKSSKVITNITEDIIRNYALQIGLIDIKVCAIDEIWSGLKLVIPVKDEVFQYNIINRIGIWFSLS
jgi:hypothetical protein